MSVLNGLTSLGEEGAEALVGVGGFTLLGEVSIGLKKKNASVLSLPGEAMRDVCRWIVVPGYRVLGSRAEDQH